MQANGRLRRPLWDVIKSIGGHEAGHQQQCRRLRLHPPDHTRVRLIPNAVHGGRGSRTADDVGAPAQGEAHDEGEAPHQPAAAEGATAAGVARRVLGGTKTCEARGAFESLVQQASTKGIDFKAFRYPSYKDDTELRPRFFNAYQASAENRLMKQVRRWQNQRDRYGAESARNWRSALDLLDQATPDGESRHKRRMETVKLPDGVLATWKKYSGEAVLELMQKTGAHLQMVPTGDGKRRETGTFTAVTLWGTPAQNEHARLLLPQFVEAVDGQHEGVKVYELSSEVTQDPTLAREVFGEAEDERTDEAYWREQESMDDSETEQLEDAVGDITYAPNRASAPIRAVWGPSGIRVRSRPETWNQLTFSAYVDALTTPIQKIAQRKLYGPQPPQSTRGHVETMTSELVRIFTGQRSSPYVSTAALDSALRFFIKYNDFPSVRRVFTALEDREYHFTASNFDALFDAAAREESVPNFLYTLRLLIRRGLRPTSRTWTAFHLLIARRFPLDSNLVTELMRRKGLLANIDTVKAVAAGNVDRALAAQLSLGKSVEDFLMNCEAQFGEMDNWLSGRSVNKMVRVLLERGRVQDAMSITRRLEAITRVKGRQGARTDTLNTFLACAMRDGSYSSALAYLRLLTPASPPAHGTAELSRAPIGRLPNDPLAIQPDHITLGMLFRLAWRHRYYNASRVLWRHGCTLGRVSWRMQDTVRQSLRKYLPKTELSNAEGDLRARKMTVSSSRMTEQRLFMALAGKFVVGIGEGLERAAINDVPLPRMVPSVDTSADASTSWIRSEGVPPTEDADLSRILSTYDTVAGSEEAAAPNGPADGRYDLLTDSVSLRERGKKAGQLLAQDLDEAGSVRPQGFLLGDLERAWQLDVLWKAEGLGKLSGLRQRGEKASGEPSGPAPKMRVRDATVSMFREMMARGVKVPMHVGEGAGVRDAEGLATARHRR